MPFENFNPLAPRGARRELVQINNEIQIFQSTSSSRSQTPQYFWEISTLKFQSTSSSRSQTMMPGLHIAYFAEFQSTSSSRSQTQAVTSGAISFGNFNPLAPRGARQTLTPRVRELDYFNPLAPRGARLYMPSRVIDILYFNPLAPRGARRILSLYSRCFGISIH